MSSWVACLDACVLIPVGLCDSLLSIAATGIYRPVWSDEIVSEIRRNAPDASRGVTLGDVDERIAAMDDAFLGARVAQSATDVHMAIVPSGVHQKDRHVVAAAVAAGANAIVTENIKDFARDQILDQLGMLVLHADEFLVTQFEVAPLLAARGIGQQIARLRDPPSSVEQHITRVSRNLPGYAALLVESHEAIEQAYRDALASRQ